MCSHAGGPLLPALSVPAKYLDPKRRADDPPNARTKITSWMGVGPLTGAKFDLKTIKAHASAQVSEASRNRRHRRGWGLYFVSLAEADAEEPIDHQWEGQDSEDGQEDRAAQESGKDLLLAEEERACGDKESKAHAPEVTRDALSAGDSASSEHTDVSRGGEQKDYAEEEAHASRGVFVRMVERLDSKRDHGGCPAEPYE